jgi:endonuclease YncB( thermonuclease family)
MHNLLKVFIASLLFWSLAVNALTIEGVVVGVADGDTITVLDANNTQHKIRLGGIDAPEKKQAFGNASKKSLSDLIYGKQVIIDYTKQDRYGRIVGKVIFNGDDINFIQIKRGMAWFYRAYKNELSIHDQSAYQKAEETAQIEKAGLWLDAYPVAPWDFRKSNTNK